MSVKPIPEGYHSLTPYLTVRGAPKVIEFLRQAFGAQFTYEPIKRPDGAVMHAELKAVMHAELKIGDSRVMIAEESEQMKATPSSLYLYVPNVDTTYQQAVKAGGKSVMEPTDMFYGDRCSCVKDACGNSWNVATHIEDVSQSDLAKRADAHFKQQKNMAA